MVYDYENRLVSVSGGSVSATFVYDADGNRVKGTVNGVTTVYIAGIYEYSSGATKICYMGPGLGPVNEVRREKENASGVPCRFIYGVSG